MNRILNDALSIIPSSNPIDDEVSIESILLADEQNAHDITQAEHSIESFNNHVDLLSSAYYSLEDISSSMEDMVASNEQIGHKTAQIYVLATKAILGDAGSVASMESVTDDGFMDIGVSLETIGEKLDMVWKAIKKAIANGIKAVSDFFAKFFTGLKGLEKRVDAVQGKIKSLKDVKDPLPKVKIPNASHLQMGGKLDRGVIERGAKVINEVLVSQMDTLVDEASNYYLALSQLDENKNKISVLGEDFMKALMAEDKFLSGNFETTYDVELPGGKAFGHNYDRKIKLAIKDKFDFTGKTSQDKELPFNSIPKLIDFTKKVEYKGTGEIDTPDLEWVSDIMDTTKSMISVMAKKEDLIEKLKKNREVAVVKIDEIVAGTSGDDKLHRYLTRNLMKAVNRDYNYIVSKVNNYIFSYCRSTLGMAEAIVAAYEK